MPEIKSSRTAVVLPTRLFLRLLFAEVRKPATGFWVYCDHVPSCIPAMNFLLNHHCFKNHILVFPERFEMYANRIFNLKPGLKGFELLHRSHRTSFISFPPDLVDELDEIVFMTDRLLDVEGIRDHIFAYIHGKNDVDATIKDLFDRIDEYVAKHVFVQYSPPEKAVMPCKICGFAERIRTRLLELARDRIPDSEDEGSAIAYLEDECNIHFCANESCRFDQEVYNLQGRIPRQE